VFTYKCADLVLLSICLAPLYEQPKLVLESLDMFEPQVIEQLAGGNLDCIDYVSCVGQMLGLINRAAPGRGCVSAASRTRARDRLHAPKSLERLSARSRHQAIVRGEVRHVERITPVR
jgi:hypothetical protein